MTERKGRSGFGDAEIEVVLLKKLTHKHHAHTSAGLRHAPPELLVVSIPPPLTYPSHFLQGRLRLSFRPDEQEDSVAPYRASGMGEIVESSLCKQVERHQLQKSRRCGPSIPGEMTGRSSIKRYSFRSRGRALALSTL